MEWNELFYKVKNPIEKENFFLNAIEEANKEIDEEEYLTICTDESLKNKKNSHRLFVNISKNQMRNMNIELIYRLGKANCPCLYQYSNQFGNIVLYCSNDSIEGTIKVLEEIKNTNKIEFLPAPLYTGLYNNWLGYGALKEETTNLNPRIYQDSRSKVMKEAIKNAIMKLAENGNNIVITHEKRNVYLNDYLTLTLLECIEENSKDNHIMIQGNYDYLRNKTKDIIKNADYYLDGRYQMLLKSPNPLRINKEVLTNFFYKSSLLLINRIDNFEKLVEEEFLNECWKNNIAPNNIAFDIGTFENIMEEEQDIEPVAPKEPVNPKEPVPSTEEEKEEEIIEEKETPKKRRIPIEPNPPKTQKMAMALPINQKASTENKIHFRQLDDNNLAITNNHSNYANDKKIVKEAYEFLRNNIDKTINVLDKGREKKIDIKDYFNRCLVYYGIQNVDLSPFIKTTTLEEYEKSLDEAFKKVQNIIYTDSNTMLNAFSLYAQSLEEFSIPLSNGKDKIHLDSNILGLIAKRTAYEFRLNSNYDHYIEDNFILNDGNTKENTSSKQK